MGRLLCIGSGKGGTGKTTFSVNIGRALSKLSQSVLIVDTDCGLRCADLMLNGGDQAVFDLGDLVENSCDASDAIVSISPCLDFIAASPFSLSPEQSETACEILNSLRSRYDFIIFDRPAGLDFSMERGCVFPESIIITTTDPLSLRSASTYTDLLREVLPDIPARLVINRTIPELICKRMVPNLDSITDTIGARLLGIIPEDNSLSISLSKGICPEKGPAAKAFKRIAKRLIGEDVPLPKLKKLI